MEKNTTLQLTVAQLIHHPRNMRRSYPKDEVQELADSILAKGRVIQPLIVAKAPAGKWVVVDGNMRLEAALLLGKKCPPLDCREVDEDPVTQLLTMVQANQARYAVDPVSEGMHYKALKDEGLSVRDISKRTGIYEVRIHNRLQLTKLEEPIQKLIGERKLPADHRCAAALLDLPSPVRLKLATRLSENPNTTIKTVLKSCENIANAGKPKKKRKNPATEIAFGSPGERKGQAGDLRAAAKEMCKACTNYEAVLGKSMEPAWTLVAHAANDTCAGCPIREVQDVCGQCPAVELLRKLSKAAKP